MMSLSLVNEEKALQNRHQADSLLLRIAQDDMQALHCLYEQVKTPVYAFALSVLKNAHDAEDVLHDTFVSLYTAAKGYRPDGKPMAWIMTVARNHCLQKLRARQKQADLPEEDWEDLVVTREDTGAEDRLILQQCMNVLSDEERQILVLHAVAGFKHREIAEMLELALPTVLSKYHRAIKKIRSHISWEEEKQSAE